MSPHTHVRDHYLPPDPEAYRRAEPATGRVIVIAPTRAACETIERACHLEIETVLEREHGEEIRELARRGVGFGIVAATGTGKTLAIRPIAEEVLRAPLRVGVVNREREATPETPTWNVVIVTTGIARRWFQDDLIDRRDTLVVDEIHQTSAELELCLALGKRVGCRFVWLSATVDPAFYAQYLESAEVLETTAFDPGLAARVETVSTGPVSFLDNRFLRRAVRERRGVAVFLPTRAEVEAAAAELSERAPRMEAAFYHGGEPIRVIRPFLDGTAKRPFLLTLTQAGQSALNVRGLDTVVIYDATYRNVVDGGRNVLTRGYLGTNDILQMAGRVHGRVPNGEVFILTDREIEFDALKPEPPEFQLAGDNERIALTAAALEVDLSDLELPVALDREAYRAAVAKLESRGIITNGRLTPYGKDVEAMPVDRPWAELLVQSADSLLPFLAVAANVDSLHRMTREECDLSGLTVYGSDHLTAYNVYREAVEQCGHVGRVYGLERHLFSDAIDEWAEDRGVLVKAIEDAALGMAAAYRTLERPLPRSLPYAGRQDLRRFQELVAEIMPFDLIIGGETAEGERVRVSDSSVCGRDAVIAGTIRYFADRFGVSRGVIEGTEIPFSLVKRNAVTSDAYVEIVRRRRSTALAETRETVYFGFVLDRERRLLEGRFPSHLESAARDALAEGLMTGDTPHPDQASVSRAVRRLDEYWRRSGGRLEHASRDRVREAIRRQLDKVTSWGSFLETRISLDPGQLVSEGERAKLDRLPSSTAVLGDKMPLKYDLESGTPVVRLALREKQARRLRASELPATDRPLRFSVYRGKREIARAASLGELEALLRALDERRVRRKARRRRRRAT